MSEVKDGATAKVHIPANTPPVFIGFTVLLTAVITVMVTFYLAIKPEIRSFIELREQRLAKQIQVDFDKHRLEMESDISHLRRDVRELEAGLKDCREELDSCLSVMGDK